jgi:hypothetical protein
VGFGTADGEKPGGPAHDFPRDVFADMAGRVVAAASGVHRRTARHAQGKGAMIETLLDACQFVLENLGEPQSSYWLASQVVEMKLWRASEADVRDALNEDIERHGERSRFVRVADDEYAMRSWRAG